MLPIFLAVTILAILFVVVIAGRPDEFKVSRSTTINTSCENVFPHVNDLRKWEAWSPWAKLDPNAKNVFEGPAEGAGAIMRWSGNKKVGQGSMTITENRENELIRLKLEFLKPFKATNTAEFVFTPDRNQTAVVWSMFGKNNFPAKAFHLFVNMDKLVGRDFEKGLADLKSIAERAAKR